LPLVNPATKHCKQELPGLERVDHGSPVADSGCGVQHQRESD